MGNIGVKIDAAEPWADGFRQALGFWNTVLIANFHEETDLNTCSLRIIDGSPAVLSSTVAARSQFTDRANFQGKIAVSRIAARQMNSAEIFATAVHEFGHMLGLKHSSNSDSVMYFLDVDGTEVLDVEDIRELSRRHELRPAILENPLVPIHAPSIEITSKKDARSAGNPFPATQSVPLAF
jgi:predicted Zn-dependent protease